MDLEPFADSAYVNYDDTDRMFEDYAYGAEDVYALPYCEYAEPVGTYVSTERIPHGELGIHRGAHVEATDGKVGRVDEFVVEPEACHITHLLLHERHIFSDKVVTIPISEIERIEDDIVHLKLSKEAVKKLPHVRTHR